MNTKRCQICWAGRSIGEFIGIPMCLECLSHRFEIDEDKLKDWEERSYLSEVEVFDAMMNVPKLKPQSEWNWWQGVARSRAYEILDVTVQEIERLRISEKDAMEKFYWMFERTMQTHRSLLRLRIGFARLARDVFNDKGIRKDTRFWDRVMHTFIFRLDQFNKNLNH